MNGRVLRGWRYLLVLVVAIVATPLPAGAETPPGQGVVRPVASLERVVIISVDGLRPDLLIRAATPNIHALIAGGSFTFWARTTEMSITLPSHVSMLTGVPPATHGITWNDDRGNSTPVKQPTVFELAKQAGYTTAMAAGKSKFVVLAKPGTLDAFHVPPPGKHEDDDAVAKAAVQIIESIKPQLLMVHFPANDAIGHSLGWGSVEQIAGLAKTDAAIGLVLDALDKAKVRDHTMIILSADHGGQGRSHGPNDVRSRHIPWIANGPGIRKDYDLNLDANTVVNTEDTFATALWALGVSLPEGVTGRPVLGAFAGSAATAAPATK